MLGAIAGDMIGSVFEYSNFKSKDFPLFCEDSTFTDDTVLTVAVAHAIMTDGDYASALKSFGRKYPRRGYGGFFQEWLESSESRPYNSWGNGSAMRVSPVGFAFDSVEEVLDEAKKSAEVTHNHPEGIEGAQATALAIFLARKGNDKNDIRNEIERRFGYILDRTVDKIRAAYSYDISCIGSVPESIIAFLNSKDYEDTIRNAISLGGDSDTMACIAGGIAQAYYEDIPEEIIEEVRKELSDELLDIIDDFCSTYNLG